LLEARNNANLKTANYSASLGYPVVAPTLAAEDQTVANQGCDLASRLGAIPSGTWTSGAYTATTAAATFARPTTSPPTTLNPSSLATCTSTVANAGGPFLSLDIGLKMVDGSTTLAEMDMDAAASGTCTTCTAKKIGTTVELMGRLKMSNAYGSELLPLLVPVRAEYYNGATWALNSDDRCTTIAPTALGVGNVTQATGSGLAVASTSVALSPSATLTAGVTNFKITPTVTGAGTVDLALNLGSGLASLTNWCGSWATGPLSGTGATPGTDMSYLGGDWCGAAYTKAPAVRIKFGSPKSNYIYLRERY
jgi:MSHA biogenesis protein MshQ